MNNPAASKKVGFLVTGSEITSGEIVNSNSAKMAEILQEWGVKIGEHLLCDDAVDDISAALRFLLERHDAVIVSGGLGPTSDDVTRIAVSEVAGQELIFNEASWQKISERLSKRNLAVTENNRQQALFPAESDILRNENGTADGCMLTHDDKLIFMLPGPPRECLPMFEQNVFPVLKDYGFTSSYRLFRWRLMGVSESAIAESMDPLAKEFNISFAYRAGYPFIDVKLMLNPHHKYHSKIILGVEKIVKPYFATHLNQTLSEQLRDLLIKSKRKIHVLEDVTQGYFLQKLALPMSLVIHYQHEADIEVSIQGMTNFLNPETDQVIDECFVEVNMQHKKLASTSKVLIRGQESLDFVAEFAALQVLKLI